MASVCPWSTTNCISLKATENTTTTTKGKRAPMLLHLRPRYKSSVQWPWPLPPLLLLLLLTTGGQFSPSSAPIRYLKGMMTLWCCRWTLENFNVPKFEEPVEYGRQWRRSWGAGADGGDAAEARKSVAERWREVGKDGRTEICTCTSNAVWFPWRIFCFTHSSEEGGRGASSLISPLALLYCHLRPQATHWHGAGP